MAKSRVVFITVLTLLVFIAGCPPAEREPTGSPEVESPKFEPAKAEPNLFGPNEVESAKAEPNLFEPNEAEPVKTEPDELAPTEIESNQVESPKVQANEADPTQAEPNEPGPTRTEPNEIEPIKAEPNDVKPPPKVTFHGKCAAILSNFVDDKGMVNYRKLKLKRSQLKQLLSEFAGLNRSEYNSWPKEDKIAFWINAYNLQMLKIIIDNYPIDSYRLLHLLRGWEPDSIRHIDKRIGGIKSQKFHVMDEVFTLPQVEELFSGKELNEPRAFFALSYATLSSPPLRNEPYYGHKLNKQLEEQNKKFIFNSPAFRIDRKKRKVYLSTILQPTWFGSGFVPKYGTNKKFKDQEPAVRAVLSFLTNYISEQDTHFLEVENYSIEYITPNWRLNDNSRK
ncbi:MAG: DUF547 domain-containing protein [Planctomycetes bacterium]|nr:DUF547 domain-containing protein [Planctomycetota bacterium]